MHHIVVREQIYIPGSSTFLISRAKPNYSVSDVRLKQKIKTLYLILDKFLIASPKRSALW